MPTQMNLPTLVAEAVLAELARNPELYRSVTPGPKGEDLTLDSIVMEADYSMTLTFSDGTTYNTPPVRGERGPKGVEGDQGPRGVGIHHTRWTATTNPEHHFGVAGHMDTYTLYGDEDELVVLGWFSVKNGENGKDPYDYAVEAGYEDTKDEFYKAIAENATHIEQIRNLVSQIEHLFDMVEDKGQEFIDQINQIIADFLAMKGAPGGFAELDKNGKVPVEQIPDEVRGIIRVNTHAELPISGVPRQLYLVVQDETAEGASTLYHWAEFEYRPATSSTTVLGLTELRGLITALDEDKASRQELNEARTELEADTLAVKQDLEALTELVGVLGDFRELAFVAHRMHLPVEGEDEVLYIVRSDETNFGDLSIYAWTIDGYQRVSGKMQEAIDQRITALIEATDTDRELFLQRLQELADEVASTYATKAELVDVNEALNVRVDDVVETVQTQDATLAQHISTTEDALSGHEQRLSGHEQRLADNEQRLADNEQRLADNEQRLTDVENFREVITVSLKSDLPAVGTEGKLYVVKHDETSRGSVISYFWNGHTYMPLNVRVSKAEGNSLAAREDGLYVSLDSKVDKVSGKQLSTEDFTSALKDKLAGLEGTHWRGTFVSLAALQAGVADPAAGDYADVDAVGADVERYIWDATDSVWVPQQAAVPPLTASQVKQLYESNPNTNVYDDTAKAVVDGATDKFDYYDARIAPIQITDSSAMDESVAVLGGAVQAEFKDKIIQPPVGIVSAYASRVVVQPTVDWTDGWTSGLSSGVIAEEGGERISKIVTTYSQTDALNAGTDVILGYEHSLGAIGATSNHTALADFFSPNLENVANTHRVQRMSAFVNQDTGKIIQNFGPYVDKVFRELAPSDHPGYVAGRYYTNPYYYIDTVTLPKNTALLMPIHIKSRVHIESLRMFTGPQAGGRYRIGIYSAVQGLVAERVLTTNDVASPGANKSLDFPLDKQLDPGMYWMGAACSVAGNTMIVHAVFDSGYRSLALHGHPDPTIDLKETQTETIAILPLPSLASMDTNPMIAPQTIAHPRSPEPHIFFKVKSIPLPSYPGNGRPSS